MLFNSVREILLRLDFIVVVLVYQLSLIFIKQWVEERKRYSENYVSLSYGLYYLAAATGILLYVIRRNYFLNLYNLFLNLPQSSASSFLHIFSIFIMAVGVLILAFSLEYNYRQFLKTRFLFSSFLIVMMILVLVFRNSSLYYSIINAFAGFSAFYPLIFIYYLIKNSLGKIRKKLIFGTFALILSLFALVGFSDQGIRVIRNTFPNNYEIVLISFEILAIIGLILLIYSFNGFNLLLEAQWKGNIIALFLIDKESGKGIYHKNFLIKSQEDEKAIELFSGGIKGIVDIINELTETKKDLRFIDKGNIKIILDYGKKIISALTIKEDLINIQFFLHKVTEQFENSFLEVYEITKKEEMFKPMDRIIEKIFPKI
ncbi:MAG: hypothetical protein HWN67_15095 [Candidatus Helarchaeota archaeon]|nr:hypothetical protein [Candidatus Helarchaeota archaeon]